MNNITIKSYQFEDLMNILIDNGYTLIINKNENDENKIDITIKKGE